MPAKLHRLHFPNVGEGIVHIPGGTPYTSDDVAQFPYGSYVRFGMKGFVYARAHTLLNSGFGCFTAHDQKMAWMVTAAALEAGDTSMTITVTATQNIALNELAYGELIIFTNAADPTNPVVRGIVSNTAIVTSGTMTVVIDSPLPQDIAVGAGVEAIINPYSQVFNTTAAHLSGWYGMVLGIPTYPLAAGKSGWLQVTGPMAGLNPDILIGAGQGDIECVFGSNGSISLRDTTTTAAGKLSAQIAGYIITCASGGGQGAPFLMLQIAH